ncbi:MAG: endonuclease MutS2 [Eubacterium sp.]|nr:endonuclease MutS2 [Eubacterium sp.]
MNEKALHTLEFYKILELLEEEAVSAPGKRKCRALRPSDDLSLIRSLQEETSASVSRLLKKGKPSFGGAADLGDSFMRLAVGSSLNAAELLRIASLLENAERVRSYGRRDKEESPGDALDPLFSALEPLPALSREIRRCLPSETDVADDASTNLRRIRRALSQSSDRIHAQLNAVLNGPARSALQDNVITMRNGRYCIPVRSDSRAAVPGMIHDQSSTGATLFIEPMSVVRLNNEIRELQLQEKAEIEAILASLSTEAAGSLALLRSDLEILISLDFIFARGRLALTMNATEPVFREDGRTFLRRARHPLIPKKDVVPIDIRLGDDFDLLIVTGPNTGGKTVSLKTAGLLSLMGQAGLHIPCLDRSELPVFSEIYADIGDEQSIEQSLSTFSAHMTNIVSFLEKADCRSFVLFDELGAGTDPTEGAALAISILSFLHDRGIRTMATTHYSELKLFALTTEGVENACCEFDVETLKPTYRLMIGIPGKSNAFAISARLGLPSYIIDDARKQIDEQEASFEDVLADLETTRLEMEEREQQISRRQAELENLKKQLQSRERSLEERRQAALDQAEDEARRILQDAKEIADRSIKAFRKAGMGTIDLADLERRRTALRKELDSRRKTEKKNDNRKKGDPLSPKDLEPGDAVHVISMNLDGIVRSKPDSKGFVFVEMGILRSKLPITDLEKADVPEEPKMPAGLGGAGQIKVGKSLGVRSEINLLGRTVDDAILELDKYLDDAFLAHLPSVRIVHGKGTGALRKGIHQYLRKQKHVKEFRLAEYGEGDAGVTVVTFK